ncbi:hypothetical protein A4D02_18095 [Niastella koreensis]|uniref:Uncharacterized protein n=2 Tax=Niastella koreensis TaxID=354356 RepID=G8TAC8_NIAKG|nr:hypothetical protein Niako_0692 [Niastella koreensis GR20-10]OQP39235.1 hypothetical protein A4D02_18095 [Niastella koreensis]
MSWYKEVTPSKGVWGVRGYFIYPFFPASLWQPNNPMHNAGINIIGWLVCYALLFFVISVFTLSSTKLIC